MFLWSFTTTLNAVFLSHWLIKNKWTTQERKDAFNNPCIEYVWLDMSDLSI